MIVRAMTRIPAAAAMVVLAGCFPFHEMQSARLVGRGRVEVTPAYSVVSGRSNGERERIGHAVGVQVATGVRENLDLRVGYTQMVLDDETYHLVAAGPKVPVSPDRVAVSVPVGVGFGPGVAVPQSLHVIPTLLVTATPGRFLELTGSAKAIVLVRSGASVAFNAGAGIGPDPSRWVVRPEVGIALLPDFRSVLWHFGIGITAWIGAGRGDSGDRTEVAQPR